MQMSDSKIWMSLAHNQECRFYKTFGTLSNLPLLNVFGSKEWHPDLNQKGALLMEYIGDRATNLELYEDISFEKVDLPKYSTRIRSSIMMAICQFCLFSVACSDYLSCRIQRSNPSSHRQCVDRTISHKCSVDGFHSNDGIDCRQDRGNKTRIFWFKY
jgi:hypothetical protein